MYSSSPISLFFITDLTESRYSSSPNLLQFYRIVMVSQPTPHHRIIVVIVSLFHNWRRIFSALLSI